MPKNPTAWLATGRAPNTSLDLNRRRRVAARSEDQVIRLIEEFATSKDDIEAIPDRRLALMFVCAHPAIEANIRSPLMMQTVLGLDAARIASAFLVAPATMGQRLSRAKAKIRDAAIPFAIPDANEWPDTHGLGAGGDLRRFRDRAR